MRGVRTFEKVEKSGSDMALEEWKDFVGNAATFFTILQFVMGSQVFSTWSLSQPV